MWISDKWLEGRTLSARKIHMPTASSLIRDERPDDTDEIASLVERAFANHPHSQQTEHIIVRELRAAGQLILPTVAVLDGKIIGYATFSLSG
jgi:putative acetyltransferase